MELTVLSVEDCPNTALLAQRLAAAGATRDQVAWMTVTGIEHAAELGMHGSPTLLVDRVDPFAEPGAPASYGCRLYPGPGGTLEGAPQVTALAAVLQGRPVATSTTVTLAVAGMTCANCQRTVQDAAEAVPGVNAALADLAAATVTVSYTAPALPAAIAAAIEDTGYHVTALGAGA